MVIALSMVVPPRWLAPLDLVGLAVCHRIPSRSFFVNQTQLPVCARDTGMFITTLLGTALLAGRLRSRAADFPRRRYLAVFALFFAVWAFDGFNSYVLLLRGSVFLYMPQNWLRLLTGALMGAAVGPFAVALFNAGVWREPAFEPTIRDAGGLLRQIGLAAAVFGLALWRPDGLYGPLAALSALGVVALLTLVNAMLGLIIAKKSGRIDRLRELLPFAALGLICTLAEIGAVAALRLAYFPVFPG